MDDANRLQTDHLLETEQQTLKTDQHIPLYLIACLILFGELLFVFLDGTDAPSDFAEYLYTGIFMGTPYAFYFLAGIWTALGPFPVRWRIPLSLAWIVATHIALYFNIAHTGAGDTGFLLLLGASAILIWLCCQSFWIARFFLVISIALPGCSALRKVGYQFGIRELFLIMIGSALVLATLKYLAPVIQEQGFNTSDITMFALLALATYLILAPLLLSTLIPSWKFILMVTLAIGLVVAGTLIERDILNALAGANLPDHGHLIGINVIQSAWVLVIGLLLRLGGYRLTLGKVPTHDSHK